MALIRLRVCAGWSEPLLVAHTTLFEISCRGSVKAAYSVTMNIFEKFSFLFKSFVKVELSYVFTIKMFSTAENCMEK